jgi:ABC-type methionine transport system ATPase subunit
MRHAQNTIMLTVCDWHIFGSMGECGAGRSGLKV